MVLVRRVINFRANGNQTLQCKETHVDTFIYSIFYYLERGVASLSIILLKFTMNQYCLK